MNSISYKRAVFIFAFLLNLSVMNAQKRASAGKLMVRIAEIEIVPEFANDYKKILKEEAAKSIRVEPGVIAIFPMFMAEDSNQVRIVEIYASKAAYEAHLKTPHFLHYKSSTEKMVRSLKLVGMDVLDEEAMKAVFRKMK